MEDQPRPRSAGLGFAPGLAALGLAALGLAALALAALAALGLPVPFCSGELQNFHYHWTPLPEVYCSHFFLLIPSRS